MIRINATEDLRARTIAKILQDKNSILATRDLVINAAHYEGIDLKADGWDSEKTLTTIAFYITAVTI